MGQAAIESAMSEAGIEWKDVDYLIDCSTSKIRPIPCNAAHFQQAAGPPARSIPCVDVQSTCLGSILAINMVNAMFASGDYRNIVIVASEAALAGANWSEPESAGLLGDGAAALVLRHEPVDRQLAFAHETFAEHLELCRVDGGGHYLPAFEFEAERHADFRFTMDGPAVFRVALKHLPPMVNRLRGEFRDASPGGKHDVHVIPHQASPKAVEIVRRLLAVTSDRYHVTVRETGNLAAASIPVMLDRVRRNGLIQAGEQVMLLGTSAGYSQAALIFQL